MLSEYIVYYGAISIFCIVCLIIVLPLYVFLMRSLSLIMKFAGVFGIIVCIICMVIFPVFMYNVIDDATNTYRLSFKKEFAINLYKQEVCPSVSMPSIVGIGSNQNVIICYPKTAKMRQLADDWYLKNQGILMMECIDKANPQYKYKCSDAANSFYRGMVELDLNHVTFEQMLEEGRKKFEFAAADARQGVW